MKKELGGSAVLFRIVKKSTHAALRLGFGT